MPRPRKLTEDKVEAIRSDWELFPEWSIEELARIHQVSRSSIVRAIEGLRRYGSGPRPISLDTLSGAGVQVDQDGKVYGLKEPFYYAPLENLPKESNPEKGRMVTCPHCPMKFTARSLLVHLVKVHKRFDLEYLL